MPPQRSAGSQTSFSRPCTNSDGDNVAPCLLRRLAAPYLLRELATPYLLRRLAAPYLLKGLATPYLLSITLNTRS
ncbi:hypothetical protein Tco_1014573 [Tanacetum coccineum]